VCVAVASIAASLNASRVLAAEPIVEVGSGVPKTELAPYFKFFSTDKQTLPYEMPGASADKRIPITLTSRNKTGVTRWYLFSMKNSSEDPRTVVVTLPHQGFPGSRILWPNPPGSRIASITTSEAAPLRSQSILAHDAFEVTVNPGQAIAVAIEAPLGGLSGAALWEKAALEGHKDSLAFFRGVIIGVVLLVAAGLGAFYVVRPRQAFLAGAAFVLAAAAFVAIEIGYLPAIMRFLPGLPARGESIRAVVEAAMGLTLAFCLDTFVELRRNRPLAGNAIFAIGLAGIALAVFGFFEPALASGLSRLLFAGIVTAGFVILVDLRRAGDRNAETLLLSWSVIVLWTFTAAVSALTTGYDALLSPLLLAGLAIVLITMSFGLAQQAFSHGILARHSFQEAGRKALALAGAQQFVWDWQPDEQDLFVGEELDRALALPPGWLAQGGVEAFIDLIHPSDRGAYLAAVDEAERRGRGAFELEFRLRRADNTYRWFLLRARAMPGPGLRAMRCIGTLADVNNRKRTEEHLLNDAVYDRITGLPNKALFLDRCSRAIAKVDAGELADVYVLLVDLDRFKTVNDALGQDAGDGLLTVTGRRLQALAGPEDTVARMPGDQFAILFVGSAPRRDVVQFVESVRKAVARPISLKPQEVFVTACIGAASYREPGLPVEQLMKDAAVALYEAKRRGSDAVEFFRTSMRDDRTELVALEAELRRAIERNEIEVHYQPIARLANLDIAGFEALVRWRHPVLGLLAPESFIALAEQTGIIRVIGRYVLHEAARQLGIWQRAFRPAVPVFMAVNLSSNQLMEPDLIDDIKIVLAREAIAKGSLKIEVTESIVMQYPERAVQILERLKQLGVGLACDDFGTGFSSLSSLRKLPFDTLKVDRTFLVPESADAKAAVILDAIVQLAHDLQLSIVAEGIENQEHIDRLGAMGCDFAQGYFIGPPMSAQQVSESLGAVVYATARGRTAMSAFWERVAEDPLPPPSTPEITTDAIARALEERERARAEAELASRQAAPAPGSAPPAPRLKKPKAAAAKTPGSRGKAGKRRRKTARKRRIRQAMQEQPPTAKVN
jgi:diguanylate cyclase (GGDEF)-like protein